MFGTLFSQSGSNFRKVGLVEFRMWSLVFISKRARLRHHLATAYQGGARLGVPAVLAQPDHRVLLLRRTQRHHLELDIPVEAAAKLIMTAGMIQPDGDPQKKLAALAEAARLAQTARTVAPAK